jgi:hypothetical protein
MSLLSWVVTRGLDLSRASALRAGLATGPGESDWIHQIGSALCRILLLINLAGPVARAARLRLSGFLIHSLIITEAHTSRRLRILLTARKRHNRCARLCLGLRY